MVLELSEEEYGKLRQEMIAWLFTQGFIVEEERGLINLRIINNPAALIVLNENFVIVDAQGPPAEKKRRAYMQTMVSSHMRALINSALGRKIGKDLGEKYLILEDIRTLGKMFSIFKPTEKEPKPKLKNMRIIYESEDYEEALNKWVTEYNGVI